jgi:hypothetical protein
MGAFQILDLIIGMAFVYFLLSLICVALQEIKARWRNERSDNLKKWIYDTFQSEGKKNEEGEKIGERDKNELGKKLWDNIIIDGLTQEDKAASYIPKEVFVSALFDEIHYNSDDKEERKKGGIGDNGSTKEPYDFNSIRESIEESTLLPNRIKRVLRQIHSESYGNLESFKERLERWFENAMDRNAGTFKKNAQLSVLIFSLIVTVTLNVDSIKLIKYFYENPAEAARVADAAEKMINDPKTKQALDSMKSKSVDSLFRSVNTSLAELKRLKLPIGWDTEELKNKTWKNFFCTTDGWKNVSILGWLITAIAVSLGAPFWYDTLNKLVDLRSAGKKPTTTSVANSSDTTKSPDHTIG